MTIIDVSKIVGEVGALDPNMAVALTAKVRAINDDERVVLDFSNVPAISSAFANALFVSLASERPLEQWRRRLEFKGLGERDAKVLTDSLQAVRQSHR